MISCAPGLDPDQVGRRLRRQGRPSAAEPLPDLLRQADLALVCSGTASLEAALAGVPHEIVYRTGRLNYLLARRLVRTERIGLSNLILDEDLVREHVQDDAAPLPLATACCAGSPGRPSAPISTGRRDACGRPAAGPACWERTAQAVLDLAPAGGAR